LTTQAFEFEAALLIETVFVPVPAAIATVDVAEDDPTVVMPDCAEPPIVIVPVVVDGPIAYVEAATPSKTKLPLPTYRAKLAAPVASPITIVLAASVPISIVFPPPFGANPPDPATIVKAPDDPPMVVAAVPETFIETVPNWVKAARVVVPVTPNVDPKVVAPPAWRVELNVAVVPESPADKVVAPVTARVLLAERVVKAPAPGVVPPIASPFAKA